MARRSDFSNPIFHDEDKARAWLEAWLWPNGPVCPKCGVMNEATLMKGKTTRAGLYQCNACREPFTVTVGTLYERSHVPLHKWLGATHLMMASKKGMSALQISRMIGVTYKTAWFLCHRIRASLAQAHTAPMGGEGKVVEADETVIGGKEKNKRKSKRNPKNIGAVGKAITFSLVERNGQARSFHVANISAATLGPIMFKHVDRASALMTDEAGQYRPIGKAFASHEAVNHGIEEYVRGDAHSNTAEGFFSILKRGVYGTFHHVSEAHLSMYLAEFDYRYSYRVALGFDDFDRFNASLPGIVGKRLTYRRPRSERGQEPPKAPPATWDEWRSI